MEAFILEGAENAEVTEGLPPLLTVEGMLDVDVLMGVTLLLQEEESSETLSP